MYIWHVLPHFEMELRKNKNDNAREIVCFGGQ